MEKSPKYGINWKGELRKFCQNLTKFMLKFPKFDGKSHKIYGSSPEITKIGNVLEHNSKYLRTPGLET